MSKRTFEFHSRKSGRTQRIKDRLQEEIDRQIRVKLNELSDSEKEMLNKKHVVGYL